MINCKLEHVKIRIVALVMEGNRKFVRNLTLSESPPFYPIVNVCVLFWSSTNKIYWEKILPITLYVHKIALPENVTLTYTLSYVIFS